MEPREEYELDDLAGRSIPTLEPTQHFLRGPAPQGTPQNHVSVGLDAVAAQNIPSSFRNRVNTFRVSVFCSPCFVLAVFVPKACSSYDGRNRPASAELTPRALPLECNNMRRA